MSEQLAFFSALSGAPEGLRYATEFISPSTEQDLIERIAALPLQPFQFGQYEGKRRVASFGFRYDYTLRRLQDAEPIPEWLNPIVNQVEKFGGPSTQVRQILCTEYDTGVGIGWHRDKPHFERVFGLSLGSPLQVPLSPSSRRKVGTLCTRCRAALALHDVWPFAPYLGTQHSRRRGTAALDHIPDDDRTKSIAGQPALIGCS